MVYPLTSKWRRCGGGGAPSPYPTPASLRLLYGQLLSLLVLGGGRGVSSAPIPFSCFITTVGRSATCLIGVCRGVGGELRPHLHPLQRQWGWVTVTCLACWHGVPPLFCAECHKGPLAQERSVGGGWSSPRN